jgi:hypothetical protein
MNKLCIEGEQSNKKMTQSFNEMYCSFFESASKNKKSSICSPLFGSILVTSLVEMSSKSILIYFNLNKYIFFYIEFYFFFILFFNDFGGIFNYFYLNFNFIIIYLFLFIFFYLFIFIYFYLFKINKIIKIKIYKFKNEC